MTEKKTHWKNEFNYDYLGAYSLPEGKDIVLTIRETMREEVANRNGKKEECLVCYFQEDVKPMVLNRTNCKAIDKIYTPFIETWPGKQIQVGAARVNAFGEMVDTLRIRPFKPKLDQKPTIMTGSEQWNIMFNSIKQGLKFEPINSKYSLTASQIKLIKDEIARIERI